MNETRLALIRQIAARTQTPPAKLKPRRWYNCAGTIFKVLSVKDGGAEVLHKGESKPITISARTEATLITPQEARKK